MLSSCSHFNKAKEAEIIAEANLNNTSVNFNIFNKYDWTPDICENIASKTGGFANNGIPYYDLNSAINSINKILQVNETGANPCEISWLSNVACKPEKIDLRNKNQIIKYI